LVRVPRRRGGLKKGGRGGEGLPGEEGKRRLKNLFKITSLLCEEDSVSLNDMFGVLLVRNKKKKRTHSSMRGGRGASLLIVLQEEENRYLEK